MRSAWLFLRGISWQIYAGIALLAALGFSHAWAYRKGEASTQSEWDKAKLEQREAQDAADEVARLKGQAAALGYENTKATQQARRAVVTQEVSDASDSDVRWRDQLLPDRVRRAISAAGATTAASGPDRTVRVPPPGGADERPTGTGLRFGAGQPGGLLGPASGAR